MTQLANGRKTSRPVPHINDLIPQPTVWDEVKGCLGVGCLYIMVGLILFGCAAGCAAALGFGWRW